MKDVVCKLKESGKKINVLYVESDWFSDILSKKTIEESRTIYPHNENKFLVQGTLTPIAYDYLLFKVGRKETSPCALLKVENIKLVQIVKADKDGNPLLDKNGNKIPETYWQEGVEYYEIEIRYLLGEIVKTQNC